MKKLTVGNIKFTKPVVEKLVDIHYILDEGEKDILKHKYFILSYDEFDKPLEQILESIGTKFRLLVVDETILVDFGDEDIQKHLDTKIFYDERWINKFNPPSDNFDQWLVEFTDQLIFASKNRY